MSVHILSTHEHVWRSLLSFIFFILLLLSSFLSLRQLLLHMRMCVHDVGTRDHFSPRSRKERIRVVATNTRPKMTWRFLVPWLLLLFSHAVPSHICEKIGLQTCFLDIVLSFFFSSSLTACCNISFFLLLVISSSPRHPVSHFNIFAACEVLYRHPAATLTPSYPIPFFRCLRVTRHPFAWCVRKKA